MFRHAFRLLILASLSGALLAPTTVVGAPLFDNEVDRVPLTNPFTVVHADFNGDGRVDIAVGSDRETQVSVGLGRGDGRFESFSTLATGTSPRGLATADVNGDGRADLVIAALNSNLVHVQLGNGDGSFRAAPSISVANPTGIVIRDFDADGKPDLAIASVADTVRQFRGLGDGTFTWTGDVGAGRQPWGIAAGDFDGDGRSDIAVTALTGNEVSILRTGTNGSLSAIRTATATGPVPRSIATADLDADGDLDLVTGNEGDNTVTVLLNDGFANFTATNYPAVPRTGSFRFPALRLADLDGDGKVDLIVSGYSVVNGSASTGAMVVRRGLGNGTFAAPVERPVSLFPATFDVADVDGDGQLDLVAADLYYAFVSTRKGVAGQLVPDPSPSSRIAVGPDVRAALPTDLDRDGRIDLIVPSRIRNVFSVRSGSGDGAFASAPDVSVGATPRHAATGDLDNDGFDDVVTVGASDAGIISVRLGNGDHTFRTAPNVGGLAGPTGIALADMDGDGRPDIVVNETNAGRIAVLRGLGHGTFAAPIRTTTGGSPTFLTVGDIDDDGDLDAVVSDSATPAAKILLGAGDGTFAPVTADGQLPLPRAPLRTALGDIDGNRTQDLVVIVQGATTSAGAITALAQARLYYGRGDGTFSPPSQMALPSLYPYGVALADVDGDGRLDLATGDYNSSTVDVHLRTTAGAFGQPFAQPRTFLAAFPYALTVTDIDGDGRPDLVAPSAEPATDPASNGVATVLRNRSTTSAPSRVGVRGQTSSSSVLIDELRLSGPDGTGDRFVRLVNTSNTARSIGGWELQGSAGGVVRIPVGAVLPAKGHYLLTGPTKTGRPSVLTLRWSPALTSAISQVLTFSGPGEGPNGGVRLVRPDGVVVDAVGIGSVSAAYAFGRAITQPEETDGQWSLVRRFSAGGTADTRDNASDFVLVATDADSTRNGAAVLGAPAPLGLLGPTNVNNGAQSGLLDQGRTANQPPNRVVTTPTSGEVSATNPATMTIRRTITNCFGRPTEGRCTNAQPGTAEMTITRLFAHVTSITTYGDTAGATNPALLRLLGSSGGTVRRSDGSEATLQKVELLSPSPQSGGGLNSILAIDLPAGGLAPGAAVSFELTARIDRMGGFSLAYNAIDDLEGPDGPPAQAPSAGGTSAPDQLAEISRFAVVDPLAGTPETNPVPSTAPSPVPVPAEVAAPTQVPVQAPVEHHDPAGPTTEELRGTIASTGTTLATTLTPSSPLAGVAGSTGTKVAGTTAKREPTRTKAQKKCLAKVKKSKRSKAAKVKATRACLATKPTKSTTAKRPKKG